MAPSRSSGAGYVPPTPILNETTLQAEVAKAQAAKDKEQYLRLGVNVLTTGLLVAAKIYAPEAMPIISALQSRLLTGNLDSVDPDELASLADQIMELIENRKKEGSDE